MSKKTITRAFHINGVTYYFNFKEFQSSFRIYNLRNNPEGTSLSKCQALLAEKLHVGEDTIRGWRYQRNGPVDLEKIKDLAAEFGLESYMELLYTNESTEEANTMKISASERQLDSLKKIYDAFILFLDEYESTEGFNDYCPNFDDITDKYERMNAINKFYKDLHKKMNKVAIVFEQESVVLHQLNIEELQDLIYEDLPNLYVDQLNPDGRENAIIREGTTWTEVTYVVAKEYTLDKLNEFMYQYF